MKKKIVATGLSLGLVAGTGAGLILQSAGLVGASPITSSVSIAATDTTVDTDSTGDADDARPNHAARLTEVLQPLVDAGTITAEQMTAVIETLDAAHSEGGRMGRGMHGEMGREMGRGMGDEMHGGRGGEMRDGKGGGRGPGAGIDAAAEALGIDLGELMTQLRDGATIAEIAEAAGIDLQGVTDAMLAEAKTHLDERVASGDLTQEQADARLAELSEKIDDIVENGRPGRPGDGETGETGDTGA